MKEHATIYSYKLNNNVKETDFLSCSNKVGELMKEQKGFLYRSIGKTAENLWVDINYWNEESDPTTLDAIFEKDSDCQRFMSMIEQSSMSMQRNNILASEYNATAAM